MVDLKEWHDYLGCFVDLTATNSFNLTKNNKYAAVIVEPREHPLLPLVLRNFMYFLHKEWSLYIFHGTKNKHYCKAITAGWGEVVLYDMNIDNLTSEQYSILLTSAEFYEKIHSEHILIFQTDCILRKKIEDSFLKYAYVGAPWRFPFKGHICVGNGGLSLRNKSKMLKIIAQIPYLSGNEDVYFAEACERLSLNVATKDEAMKFAVETLYYNDPIGLHNTHKQQMPSIEAMIQLLTCRETIAL